MRRPFAPLALLLLGMVLGIGGLSAHEAVVNGLFSMGADTIRFIYAFGATSLVLVGLLVLAVQRARQAWPFELREEPPRSVPLVVGAIAAGLGAGTYSGLLHDLSPRGIHVAAVMSLFVLSPFALLACAMGSDGDVRGLGAVLAYVLALEVSAQIAYGISRATGRFYWSDVTSLHGAVLAAGVFVVLVVGLIRRRK